jgi:hypothetical protein
MTDDLVKMLRDDAKMQLSVDYDTERAAMFENKAADRIEKLQAALQLAIEMRLTQKLYFKARTPDLLINSKMCEAAFDRAIVEKKDD